MPKFVRLSQGNHGINWTPWSRLVGGVYSLSLILSCSTSTRPGDTCTPMCTPSSTTSRLLELPVQCPIGRRVPGLGQITWWIVMTKKMRGHSGEKIAQKSRNSWRVSGGGVGTGGMVINCKNWRKSWNQIQTLKDCLCCHIYCAQLGTPGNAIVVASCVVSNRESWYLRTKLLLKVIKAIIIVSLS